MKTTIKIEKEVDIQKVVIDVAPRHIGDDEDDDMPTDFPGLCDLKENWKCSVIVDTGQIEGWPVGDARTLHIKVCDAGLYTLYDSEGNGVAVIDGYVPNGLVPGSYGDYIEMDIDENGIITNWPKRPDLSDFFEDE